MTSATAAEALGRLVDQFSDPLSFFRELIQNAVDAGSTEVEIRIEHSDGIMNVHVDDFGDGMNREIIDRRLTRLFSSRKDGDLTKIGKFGIGFVSVFAIEPDAVVVDTSRDGENWRLLFNADRSFERIVRPHPVEGTKIRIVKQATTEQFLAFEARAAEVVRYWCRFVSAEIRFQGKKISEKFALDSLCQLTFNEEGTQIIVGYPSDGNPLVGFYNSGLTLIEKPAPTGQRASVMVSSRYLEHTLARDDVRQDDNYHKVMRRVSRLLDRELPERLLSQLEASVEQDSDPKLLSILARCLEPELSWVFEAVDLHHGGGHREDDDWVAEPHRDQITEAGHLVYGPSTSELPAGAYRASWLLRFDWDDRPSGALVTLDVYDAEDDKILATEKVHLRHVAGRDQLTVIDLKFKVAGGERLEFRTLWHGDATVRQREVRVTGGDSADPRRSRYAGLRLFTDHTGQTLTIKQVADAAARSRLVVSHHSTPLHHALADKGLIVLQVPDDTAWRELIAVLCPAPPDEAESRFCLPAKAVKDRRWSALEVAVLQLLEDRRIRCDGVKAGRFDRPGSSISDRVAVAQRKPFTVDDITAVDRLDARGKTLVINLAHPTVKRLLDLAASEAELAAYLLLKLFSLRGDELTTTADSHFAASAWERRCRTRISHQSPTADRDTQHPTGFSSTCSPHRTGSTPASIKSRKTRLGTTSPGPRDEDR